MPIDLWLCSEDMSRTNIELRHLRCFLAIAEEGNLTRAAARLHLTQPAVSRTLAALERHLGARLVDRSTHHLALTPEGRTFHDRAAAAVTAFDAAVDPELLRHRPLRLGHAWSAFGPYTTPLLRRWQAEHPGTPLELLRVDDRTAGLLRGEVDAALLRGPVEVPGLATEELLTEERVAAVPADSPLAARPALALADLAAETAILNPVSGTTTLDLWPAAARPPHHPDRRQHRRLAQHDRRGPGHRRHLRLDRHPPPPPGRRLPPPDRRAAGAGPAGLAGGRPAPRGRGAGRAGAGDRGDRGPGVIRRAGSRLVRPRPARARAPGGE
ncbi:hypothetical protein GCM10019017_36200 [Streptomyces showdoensis]